VPAKETRDTPLMFVNEALDTRFLEAIASAAYRRLVPGWPIWTIWGEVESATIVEERKAKRNGRVTYADSRMAGKPPAVNILFQFVEMAEWYALPTISDQLSILMY
jgi:hypothetical protein